MNTETTLEHPIDAAARLCGGRPALANRLKVTVAAIGNWKIRGSVPVKYCMQIQSLTRDQVRVRELRPTDWREIWPELATHTNTTTAEGQGA